MSDSFATRPRLEGSDRVAAVEFRDHLRSVYHPIPAAVAKTGGVLTPTPVPTVRHRCSGASAVAEHRGLDPTRGVSVALYTTPVRCVSSFTVDVGEDSVRSDRVCFDIRAGVCPRCGLVAATTRGYLSPVSEAHRPRGARVFDGEDGFAGWVSRFLGKTGLPGSDAE